MLSAQMAALQKRRFSGQFTSAGYLVGIALGGFFDGILLHQVLQWHHLLSLVDNPAVQDLRVQILADGLFHVLMYIVAAIGLAFLWKSREEFSEPPAGRWLFGTVLLGFGLWNVADVGLFHWILRIHRIRVDSPDPLFWDLLWLAVFGVLFLIAGWVVRSRPGPDTGAKVPGTRSIASLIAAGVITAGAVAALPPSDSKTTMVVFKSDIQPYQVFDALEAADARVVWADRTGTVWAVNMADSFNTLQLYRHGAMLISNSLVGMGCLSWWRS